MTREEAIEELKTRYLTMSQCLDKEELHKANKAIDMAIQVLEQTRWIPVSERLPDKEGNYLITAQPTYNHDKDIRIAHWSSRWVGYVKSEIIAWMPLPQPYNGESEEI